MNDADENSVPWFALRGAEEGTHLGSPEFYKRTELLEEPELSTDPLIFTDPIAMDSIARQLA